MDKLVYYIFVGGILAFIFLLLALVFWPFLLLAPFAILGGLVAPLLKGNKNAK